MDGVVDQAAVRALWEEVLGGPLEGANPTFFESGGDSISALSVIFRVEEVYGVSLDVGDLFEAPSLSTFTARIAERRA